MIRVYSAEAVKDGLNFNSQFLTMYYSNVAKCDLKKSLTLFYCPAILNLPKTFWSN